MYLAKQVKSCKRGLTVKPETRHSSAARYKVRDSKEWGLCQFCRTLRLTVGASGAWSRENELVGAIFEPWTVAMLDIQCSCMLC